MFRGLHSLIQVLLEKMEERIDAEHESINNKDIQEKILAVVEQLDEVEGGDFDAKVGTKVKLSEFLIGKLRGTYFNKFLNNVNFFCMKENFFLIILFQAIAGFQPWSIRRLEVTYKNQDVETNTKMLKLLVERAKNSEEVFNIVCSILNNIFVTKFRRGECLGSQLSTKNDAEILRKVAAQFVNTKEEKKIDQDFE